MPLAAVATYLDVALDVAGNVSPQFALDLVAAVDFLADGSHIIVAQVLRTTSGVDTDCSQNPARRTVADSIDVRQRVENRFVVGQINTRDTSQTDLLWLPKSEELHF